MRKVLIFRLTSLAKIAGFIVVPTLLHAGELHDAVRAGDNAAVLALLDGRAQVNDTDYVVGTPLHLAVIEGHVTIAKLLIDGGADVNAPSEQQAASALHLAARFGDAAMAALLLDRGA